MNIELWLIGSVALLCIIWVICNLKRKKWCVVYLANNDVYLAYRTMSEWWWFDMQGLMVFRKEDGKRIKASKHWILKIEEISKDEIPMVKQMLIEKQSKESSDG